MNKKKYKFFVRCTIAVTLLLLATIVIIILGKNQLDNYKEDLEYYWNELEMNRQVVYVVSDETFIKKGEVILSNGDNANVMRQEIYSGLEPEYYITEEDIGSIAIVDMEPGTPVMKNMITTMVINHDTRDYEIGVVELMLDQQVNDFVDIRIMFPNGEDYLVLSKKQINKLVLDSAIFYTHLNEEEILRLASATIDAYTMTGTKIYATRYIESNIQNEAIPDYKVSAATIDLMTQNPNIVTLATETLNLAARLSLEQRMQGLTEEQLAAVAEGHGIQDTAKASVLTNGVQYRLEGTSALEEQLAEEEAKNMTNTTATETTEGVIEGDDTETVQSLGSLINNDEEE